MPKVKTSRAAAKRFKKTGTGKLKRMKAYNEMEKTNLEFNDLLMRQNRFLIEQNELLRKRMGKTGEENDE